MIVRRWLWKQGFRYRLHRKDLPGKPDIVLPKYHVVIFVHGCFWHRHNCKYAVMPETRRDFWETKLNGNAERDKINMQKLADLGWRVLVIWECEINKWNQSLEDKILNFINYSIDESQFLYSDHKMPCQIAADSEPEYI